MGKKTVIAIAAAAIIVGVAVIGGVGDSGSLKNDSSKQIHDEIIEYASTEQTEKLTTDPESEKEAEIISFKDKESSTTKKIIVTTRPETTAKRPTEAPKTTRKAVTTTKGIKTTSARTTQKSEPTTKNKSVIAKTTHQAETPVKKNDAQYDYILNTNTKKFHYTYCKSVSQMKESNKKAFHGSRDEAIGMGYSPCGNCKP